MNLRSTLKVKVKGQGHQGKNRDLGPHLTGLQGMLEVKGHMGQGQRSHGSRSKVTRVRLSLEVKGHGHQVKYAISSLIWQTYSPQVILEVKGHGSRSLSLKVMILAGGLTSTSSCIFKL